MNGLDANAYGLFARLTGRPRTFALVVASCILIIGASFSIVGFSQTGVRLASRRHWSTLALRRFSTSDSWAFPPDA